MAEQTGNEELAAVIGIVASIALSDPGMFTDGQLLDAEVLLDLASDYASNLNFIAGTQMKEDFEEMEEEARRKIEEGRGTREEVEEDPITGDFLMYLQSVDSGRESAIQGQYDYDNLYDYDILVSNYHKQQLLTGVQ